MPRINLKSIEDDQCIRKFTLTTKRGVTYVQEWDYYPGLPRGRSNRTAWRWIRRGAFRPGVAHDING